MAQVAHNDAQDVYQPYPGSYGLMAVDDGAALDSATPSAPLQVGLEPYARSHE